MQSQRVREEIVKICKDLIIQKTFKERGDQEWVYQSLAQAYLGLGNQTELKRILVKINKLSKGQFDIDTFKEYNKKLVDNIELIRTKTNYR